MAIHSILAGIYCVCSAALGAAFGQQEGTLIPLSVSSIPVLKGDGGASAIKRTLVVHAGPAKTGTTSVQECFAKTRVELRGLLLVDTVNQYSKEMSILAAAIDQKACSKLDHWKKRGEEFDNLLARVKASPSPTVLLSSENFASLCSDGWKLFRSLLPEFNKVVVVYVHRNANNYFISIWEQINKLSKKPRKINPEPGWGMYQRLIKNVEKGMPQTTLMGVSMEGLQEQQPKQTLMTFLLCNATRRRHNADNSSTFLGNLGGNVRGKTFGHATKQWHATWEQCRAAVLRLQDKNCSATHSNISPPSYVFDAVRIAAERAPIRPISSGCNLQCYANNYFDLHKNYCRQNTMNSGQYAHICDLAGLERHYNKDGKREHRDCSCGWTPSRLAFHTRIVSGLGKLPLNCSTLHAAGSNVSRDEDFFYNKTGAIRPSNYAVRLKKVCTFATNPKIKEMVIGWLYGD
jgi:hypothetical protein